jgi:hypothetical protein
MDNHHPEEELTNDSVKPPRKKHGPYKGRECDLFVLWLSMPLALRSMAAGKLTELGYEVDDPELKMLPEARSHRGLAKILKVTPIQLSRWANDPNIRKRADDLNLPNNVLRFKNDVDHAFTQKTIAEGDASRVMA